MKWTHDDLMRDLAVHLTKPERMVWADMQLGPMGSPRPDVYTICKSYTKPSPIAYEIKISVSDFRADVTKGKFLSYLAFASGVIFCVPQGLINKTDVPATCGLMVRGENGWKTLKGPTMSPTKLPQDAMLKLLIDGVDRVHPVRREQRLHEYSLNLKLRKQYGDDVADVIRDLARVRSNVENLQYVEKNTIEVANARAKEIIDRAHHDRDSIATTMSYHKAELCRILDLPSDSSGHTIGRKLNELRTALSEKDLIRRCILAIDQARSEINKASELLPRQLATTDTTTATDDYTYTLGA